MIGGSNALGEALPPHFQFQTSAQPDETQQLNNAMMNIVPKIRGKFGHSEEQLFEVTFGMNAKGGMDAVEFRKYIRLNIMPLYPDVEDKPGKRVMVKVDSGPGRLDGELLAEMRHLGFYMFPGVPNTTAVSQETDRNYGPFKTQFRKNLDLVVSNRIANELSFSLPPWLVCLVVFGGEDPVSGYIVEVSAFDVGFSREQCVKAWAKVGAAPMTRACLKDAKVRHELGDGGTDMEECMLQVQSANLIACNLLQQHGYSADVLRVTINATKTEEPITARNSAARVALLAKSKTHGAKFTATGGGHITSADFFKSMEVPVREQEIADLEKIKKDRLQLEKNEEDGKAAWDEAPRTLCPVANPRPWLVPLLDRILLWHGKSKDELNERKANKLLWMKEIIDEQRHQPPRYDKWTTEDEDRLADLKKMEIDIGDTALGRHKALKKRECVASLNDMDRNERDALRRKLDMLDNSTTTTTTDGTNTTTEE